MTSREVIGAVEDALADGSASREPHATYRVLREQAPVYWSAHLQQWLLTSFDVVERVLMQPGTFSNYGGDSMFIARLGEEARSVPVLAHHFAQRGLIKSDPPEHTRLRRTVRAPFSVHSVVRLTERIQDRVDSLLDGAGDKFDVKADVGRPLTVSVISDLLGVPEASRADFPAWSDDFIGFFGTPLPTMERASALNQSLTDWRALLVGLLTKRRRSPTDDLLSYVSSQVQLGELSLEEALFTCVHLMVGGFETTASAIATTIFFLLSDPDAMRAVRASPDLVPVAIEEAIRLESPVARGRRTATQDHAIGGQLIKAGEVVMPVFIAANRDPDRFERSDAFDLHRDAVGLRHDAFGRGTHFCLGAPLARLEAQIAVTTLLRRFPDVRAAAGFAPKWEASLSNRTLESMPVETGSPGRAS
jgi:cytochrome P450